MANTLVFVHNYRSGGTAINLRLLEYTYPRGKPIAYDDHPIFKFGMLDGKDYLWEDFLAEAKRGRKRYFIGHLPYGVHLYTNEPADYVTNVRLPLPRLLSGFRRNWDGELDPKTWMMRHWETDNGMTKRLAGLGPWHGKAYDFIRDCEISDEHDFTVTEELYEIALDNLKKYFSAVIIHEKFTPSLVWFEAKHKLPPLFSMTKQYLNFSQKNGIEFDESFLEELRELNRFDYQLYDFCCSWFAEEFSENSEQLQKEVDVRHQIDRIFLHRDPDGLDQQEITDRIRNHLAKMCDCEELRYLLIEQLLRHPQCDDAWRVELLRAVAPFLEKKDLERLEASTDSHFKLPQS